jgi:transcriptional regulator with XRE-family HTH domain
VNTPPIHPDQPLSGLGQALRWLREKQTRKQYRVADSAGITKGMLSAYETGRQRPSLETLEKLLQTLGCDLNDLHNALQIVNGRPEGIKSWRGWHTTNWLDGANPAMARPGTTNPFAADRVCEPRTPYLTDTIDPAGDDRSALLRSQLPADPRAPQRPSGPAGGPGGPFPASGPLGGAPNGAGAAGAGTARSVGTVDLFVLLGLDQPRLAPEEERALRQMLEGFHRLLRYWHSVFATSAAAAAGRSTATATSFSASAVTAPAAPTVPLRGTTNPPRPVTTVPAGASSSSPTSGAAIGPGAGQFGPPSQPGKPGQSGQPHQPGPASQPSRPGQPSQSGQPSPSGTAGQSARPGRKTDPTK